MPAPATGGQSGNGASHWHALAERAKGHTLTLKKIAGDVGPDRKPSDHLLERLSSVNSFLREVLMLVDDVRSHTKPRTVEAGLLDKFSQSIQAARTAIGEYEFALDRELRIQAVEEERVQYRSHEAALKDRRTLRELSSATVNGLDDLRKHLDHLLDWLQGGH